MRLSIEKFDKLPKEEKEFILTYGATNCFRSILKTFDEIKSIGVKLDDDLYRSDDFLNIAKKFAGKKVLITRIDWSPKNIEYFICGDDVYPFKEQFFKK